MSDKEVEELSPKAICEVAPGFDLHIPTHQNSLDIFSGSWLSRFPSTTGLKAGEADTFDDQRVSWVASVLGGLNGLSILELGPFEAYTTHRLQLGGAAQILSIEGSRINFLKCLVVKNILGLNATFLHGDFIKYLENTSTKFDICWASGVLYHMTRPIQLLKGIRRVSDSAFIWSHYYNKDDLIRTNSYSVFDHDRDRVIDVFDRQIRLYHRTYPDSGSLFAGGSEAYSYWLEKDDILYILKMLGYSRIDIGIDNPAQPSGPAFFLLARTT